MTTFTWSPAASYTTVVFFPASGVSFDLPSFNFHVPICGSSAAKHVAPAKKQSATINPTVFDFMTSSSTDFPFPSRSLCGPTNGRLSMFFARRKLMRKQVQCSRRMSNQVTRNGCPTVYDLVSYLNG